MSIIDTPSIHLMERDRVQPMKEAILRGFDLMADIQQTRPRDLERMFFAVGVVTLRLAEINDWDRDEWTFGMSTLCSAFFGSQPKNPDMAALYEMFKARIRTIHRERRARMS
jgi:hypothetical protein